MTTDAPKPPLNRRELLRMIGITAGSAAMYQAMSGLGFAAESPYKGPIDLLITAFGFRNLANYRDGLEEFYRTLKPGGELGILDFSEPGGLMGKLYAFYFRRVLPTVGSLVSGVSGPYRYLPSSVQRFPAPPELLQTMESVGFEQVSWTPYSFGIAGLYRAVKR